MFCINTIQAQVSMITISMRPTDWPWRISADAKTVRTRGSSATKMAGQKQNPCFLSSPRPDGSDRSRRRGRRWPGRPVVLLLVLAECLLNQVLQIMEPPLLLRGCVSPKASQLGFVIHDLVEHFWTPWEEALPEFHWNTEFSLRLVQVQSEKQKCDSVPTASKPRRNARLVFRNSEVKSKLYVTTLKCPPSGQIAIVVLDSHSDSDLMILRCNLFYKISVNPYRYLKKIKLSFSFHHYRYAEEVNSSILRIKCCG